MVTGSDPVGYENIKQLFRFIHNDQHQWSLWVTYKRSLYCLDFSMATVKSVSFPVCWIGVQEVTTTSQKIDNQEVIADTSLLDFKKQVTKPRTVT